MKFYPLLFSLSLIASCARLEEPQFRSVQGFGINSLSLTEATIGFSTTYYNPNNFGVQLKEATVDVYLDSVYVGKFVQRAQITASKRSEFSVPFEGKIGVGAVVKLNLPKLLNKEVLVRADGNVKVGKGGVFVTRAVKYQGKQKLDPSLLKNPAGAGFFN